MINVLTPVGDETIVIFRVHAVLDDLRDFVVFQLLTEGEKGVCKLGAQHGAVLSLVVQLQTFQEVLVASLVFVFLGLAVDGEELLKGQEFLAPLLGASELLDGGQCGVVVECPQYIAEVEGINLVAAVSVEDREYERRL